MGVPVAYIALYNQSRSNGRLRDITLRCSPTLVRYAMEEAISGRRFYAGEIGIQMKHVARITATITPPSTSHDSIHEHSSAHSLDSRDRVERAANRAENSRRAPANKFLLWEGLRGWRSVYECFTNSLFGLYVQLYPREVKQVLRSGKGPCMSVLKSIGLRRRGTKGRR